MPGKYAWPPPSAETIGRLPLVRALLMRPPAMFPPPSEEAPAEPPVTAFSARIEPCVAGLHGSVLCAPVIKVSKTTVLLEKIAPGFTTTRSPSSFGVPSLVVVRRLMNQPPTLVAPTAAADDAVSQASVDTPVTQRTVAVLP